IPKGRYTQSFLILCHLPKMLVEGNDRFDAQQKVFHAVVLIWGMDRVAVEPEAHQHGVETKFLFEERDNRDAATISRWDRCLPPDLYECLTCRAKCLLDGRRYGRFATVMRS